MSKGLKIAAFIALVIVGLAVIVGSAWILFTRRAFPKTDGTIEVAGLLQPVEILRDEYGVVHIYGHTPEDLYFAEGFVHAQDRFWQMEYQRRLASARMSEIFGEPTVVIDRFLRHFGFQPETHHPRHRLHCCLVSGRSSFHSSSRRQRSLPLLP